MPSLSPETFLMTLSHDTTNESRKYLYYPPLITLRDQVKKLSSALESRPKLPASPTDDQVLMLTRFHDFQTRLGAVLEAYEMELDRMLTEL